MVLDPAVAARNGPHTALLQELSVLVTFRAGAALRRPCAEAPRVQAEEPARQMF